MIACWTALVFATAGPPTAWPRGLNAQQTEQIQALKTQMQDAVSKRDYAAASAKAQQVVTLLEQALGAESVDARMARLTLEKHQRLAQLPAEVRKAVLRAQDLKTEAKALLDEKRYVAGEQKLNEALAICRKAVGEEHLETALCYNVLASSLHTRGEHGKALALFEKSLAIELKALGEWHVLTAPGHHVLGQCLERVGQPGRAIPHFEKAAAVFRRFFGADNTGTAGLYTEAADCLRRVNQPAKALLYYEKALAINRQKLGEWHLETAESYWRVAVCLGMFGEPSKSLPLAERGLAICRKSSGEEHVKTGRGYQYVAAFLFQMGQPDQALPLLEKGLAITRNLRGELHADTWESYQLLGMCLVAMGQTARALPLFERAQWISSTLWGEVHDKTFLGYACTGMCLYNMNKHSEANALWVKAAEIYWQVNRAAKADPEAFDAEMAQLRQAFGQADKNQRFLEEGLVQARKDWGEDHHRTASAYSSLASNWRTLGQPDKALPYADRALAGYRKSLGERHFLTAEAYHDVGDCLEATGQFDKALPRYEKALSLRRKLLGDEHPKTGTTCNKLAVCLDQQGRLPEAVRLLQALLPGQEAARYHGAISGFDRALASSAHASPHVLLALGLARLRQPANAFRHAEASLARGLLDDLAHSDPADAARLKETSAQLRTLDNTFLTLFGQATPGAGQRSAEGSLAQRRRTLYSQMARLATEVSTRQVVSYQQIQQALPPDAAYVFWLDHAPLRQHWGCVLRREGPPVWVPLPGSGAGRSWTAEDLSLAARCVSALMDPGSPAGMREKFVTDFRQQRLRPLEPYLAGARQLFVVPVGLLARVPLELLSPEQAVHSVPSGSLLTRIRRAHRPLSAENLLAVGDPVFSPPQHGLQRPTSVVLRGTGHKALPATAFEVRGLAALVKNSTTLLRSDASEQALDRLRGEGQLERYRILHFATHGEVDEGNPDYSRLILAQDRLPDPLKQPGSKVYTGELTVKAIRRDWTLDADLVVLSACQTALGRDAGGDGLLGFAHAFLARGARSVVLTRWKVEDTATALFMVRFYENLLGSRKGAKPLGRAAALAEAKKWLQELPRGEAEKRVAALTGGVLRGSEVEVPPIKEGEKPKLPDGDRPYAHPFYWAAFLLVGDPD